MYRDGQQSGFNAGWPPEGNLLLLPQFKLRFFYCFHQMLTVVSGKFIDSRRLHREVSMGRLMHCTRRCGAALTLAVAVFLSAAGALAQPSGDYDIYIYNVKTATTRQITTTSSPKGEFNPSLSNNNRYVVHDVVYVGRRVRQSLFVTDLRTGRSRPLPGGEGGNDASWSPNGQYIAFDRAPTPDRGVPTLDRNIYVVQVRGARRAKVVEDAVDPDWSPNSKYLVFTSINPRQRGNQGRIQTQSVRGGPKASVARFGQNPVWSPNGKYIAYSDGDEIFKVPVSRTGSPIGPPVQLTRASRGSIDQQPTWWNNSKTIVFHSNRGGNFDLWAVRASGGRPARLAGHRRAGDFDPTLSSNGNFIVYAAVAGASAGPDGGPDGTEEGTDLRQLVLEQNTPNPFNPTTTIQFYLPEATQVQLTVYNALGQAVKTLATGGFSAGQHQVVWDARDDHDSPVPSGIYIYQLQAGSLVRQQKMVLLK